MYATWITGKLFPCSGVDARAAIIIDFSGIRTHDFLRADRAL